MKTATVWKMSPKINTGPIVTIFECLILFAFYIVGKVRYKWIGVRDVKLNRVFRFSGFKKEIVKHFFCSFVHFKLICEFQL